MIFGGWYMPEVIDECYGCVHDEPSVENALEYCSHCMRGSIDKWHRENHEDLYESKHLKKEDI